jgi:hypothetical protein
MTGTARRNSGIYEAFVAAKVDDIAGRKLWPWGRICTAATADRLVSRHIT